ncbi:MAG: hypothetical protein ACOZNI_23750 [Myxococcota bacterium]
MDAITLLGLDGHTIDVEPGRDLIVAGIDGVTEESRDQVAWGWGDIDRGDPDLSGDDVVNEEYDYVDPNVTRVDANTWRVECFDYNELVYFEAPESSVCTDWEEAWLADADLPASLSPDPQQVAARWAPRASRDGVWLGGAGPTAKVDASARTPRKRGELRQRLASPGTQVR